jgi:hypothetical protein
MGNFIAVTDQTGKAVVPATMNGLITDIYIAATATATKVALYNGSTPSAAGLLYLDKVAANSANQVTNCKIQFTNGGLYALVDANTEALVLHGEWGKNLPASLLSGG